MAGFQTDFARRCQRVEHAGHDLSGPRPTDLVLQLGFEQFGVGEDDSELVVQPMEQQAEVGRLVWSGSWGHVRGHHHEASLLVRSARPGWRQSVSTKNLTDPPAVRMYSTLPLEIQL